MKIKEIEERIKSNYDENELNKYSSFVLSEYLNSGELTEVIPLENKSENIAIDGKDTIITDKNGNILMDKKEKIFEDKRILFVDSNRMVVETTRESWTTLGGQRPDIIDISIYEYNNDKISKVETLFYEDADKSIDIKLVNKDKGLLMINKVNRNDKKSAFLYSVKERRVISPIFNTLEKVSETRKDIYKYTDFVVSNKTLNDEHKVSGIIGFISGDGVIFDEIYDENRNCIRDIKINNETKYHDYDLLKEDMSYELDKAIDNEKTIQNIRDSSIKILEIDAKIKY